MMNKAVIISVLSVLMVGSVLGTKLINAQNNVIVDLGNAAKLLLINKKLTPPPISKEKVESAHPDALTKEILARSSVNLLDLSEKTGTIMRTLPKTQENEGYIIQLKYAPAIIFYKQTENITEENYKLRLQLIQDSIKSTIKFLAPQAKIIRGYQDLFNGLVVDNISEQEIIRLKEQLPEIKQIFPNYKVQSFLRESIPLINADDVWSLGYTGRGMKVAIIDTGVDNTQLDLDEGKVIQEDCYCLGNCCPDTSSEQHGEGSAIDDNGHGTHVAGIAAGDGDASEGELRGVAPDASLIAIKVLNSSGWGFNSDIIAGIEAAVNSQADVINLSLGGSGTPDDPMSMTIDNAVEAGVTVVAAAGNYGPNYQTIQSPGCAKKAITVGASDKNDVLADFSSRGPTSIFTIKPDIVAPGVDICSSRWDSVWPSNQCFDDKHVFLSGTSMATPHVTGAVALIKQAHPNWTPDEIKNTLRNTALNINDDILSQGYGRIDVLKAVRSTTPAVVELDTAGFLRGLVNITGVITLDRSSGIKPIVSYIFEYGSGTNPTNWNTINRGRINLGDNSGLITIPWNTTSIPNGTYNLRLKVYVSRTNVSQDRTIIFIDNNVMTGWPFNAPLPIDRTSYFESSPAIADINQDGFPEVVIHLGGGGVEGMVCVVRYNGEVLNGWPKVVGGQGLSSPAIADLDPNYPGLEIVVGVNATTPKLYIWHADGTPVEGFPLEEGGGYCGQTIDAPAIDDIDHDGILEIVVSATCFDPSPLPPWHDKKMLYVFKADGELMPGSWPKEFEATYWFYAYSSPALADLDRDGKLEIIFNLQDTGQVYVYRQDGASFEGWPQSADDNDSGGGYSSPAVGDLDNDGDLEIVVSVSDYSEEGSTIYAWHHTGEMVTGWPKSVGNTVGFSPALTDIDQDRNLEIVTARKYWTAADVMVLRNDGSFLTGWPKTGLPPTSDLINGVVVGDIDGDEDLEIIQIIDNGLYAWHHNGQTVTGFPRGEWYATLSESSTPALADINSDGKLDIIVGKWAWSLGGGNRIDWPMFHHDSQRRGLFF